MVVEGFDGASQVIAGPMNIAAQEWTDAFAPELLVMAEEIPVGLFAPSLGRTVIGIASGLAALAYIALAKPMGRDREAVQHMSAHWLTHPNAPGLFGLASVAAATPQALANDLQALKTGIAASNWDLIRSAFLHSPQDVTSYFQSLGAQFNALFAAAPAALPPVGPGTTEAVVQAVQAVVGYGEVF